MTVTSLISLLSSKNPLTRNEAALALKDRQENSALEPLLAAIFKKENHGYNGTMVYALESLDCSKKLKEIFQILFYETFESKMSAYSILTNQEFEFTKQDLLEIQQIWDDCKLHPEKCPNYDEEETRAMMEDMVTSFIR
ncbi:MAG: HEAT repeat domain-containing protein [Leptospiraceae bacterium]|nr:HEAT repeat domain-containing protein [Leptospiraceae bacterium]